VSERQIIRVRQVMNTNFELMDRLATVDEGLRKMKTTNIRALIVNKRYADDAYGIVLLSDIAKNVLAKNRSPKRVSLYEVMSKPVIWVEPELDIRYCATLFDNFGLGIAPVLEEGNVIGVVSYHEIVLNGLVDLE
jgi:predicted transcriptional regulator